MQPDRIATQLVSQGFAVVHDFVDAIQVERLVDEAQRLGKECKAPNTVYEKFHPTVVHSIWDVISLSEDYFQVSRSPRLLEIVREILQGEVYLHQNHINYKSAFVGSGFAWHSDFMFWSMHDGIAEPRAITVQIMLDECTLSNGPMIVSPRSHTSKTMLVNTIAETSGSAAFQSDGTDSSQSDLLDVLGRCGEQAVCGKPGSLLVMDCRLLHASCSNVSLRPRRLLNLCYNSVENGPRRSLKHARPEYITSRDTTPIR